MKKIFIAIVLCVISFNVFGQTYQSYKDKYAVNFVYGVIFDNYTSDYENDGNLGCGISIIINNVYFDIFGGNPTHYHDLNIDTWEDVSVFSMHTGYRINIKKYIGITPIIGYIQIKDGYVDGSDWHCNDYGVYNRFNVDEIRNYGDLGIILDANIPIMNYTLYNYSRINFKTSLGVTLHSIYIGLGCSVNFM